MDEPPITGAYNKMQILYIYDIEAVFTRFLAIAMMNVESNAGILAC